MGTANAASRPFPTLPAILLVALLPFPVTATLVGDFDDNGVVDLADFFLFADVFQNANLLEPGTPLGDEARFDLDGDGQFDFDDFFLFADRFGQREDSAYVRARGSELVVGADNTPILLQGVNFGNLHFATWEGAAAAILSSAHHDSVDFQRVADLGMNVVRFNLNYRIFEDDARPSEYKDEGWQWLDRNLAWARQAGLCLILDLHSPQGGAEIGGSASGAALWTNPVNQQRLVALWKQLATRYRDSTHVAAYDLLNEPDPPADLGPAPGSSWQKHWSIQSAASIPTICSSSNRFWANRSGSTSTTTTSCTTGTSIIPIPT